ncbi:MAG: GHKL domain-containing protein [Ignavibacteriae bacterium]|nr:GHKL domain-containing protein [Ignavibacteriota bacterium]
MVLKNFDQVISNFKFSYVFIKEILLLSTILGGIFFYLSDFSYSIIFPLIFIIIFSDLLILYLIGKKRRIEIEEIKTVIKSIRKNRYLDEEQIVLSKPLKELEGIIKAISRKTNRDFANIEKLAQARSEFLGYVSHELRTPIFTIQGYLETLLNGAIDNPKVNRSFLEKALNHSNNLNTLLNDLIEISMIESGLMSLSFRYFNLFNFINEIISETKQLELNNNISINLLEFNKEIGVYGDKERLKQVFYNLLSNAIKYTNEGKIEIIVIEKSKSVIIKVKDSGIGIPEKELDRIFQRFYRTERERESNVPGTGLGLAIVKHILEAHQTTIEVTSEINVGSEFSFKLKKE